MTVMTKIEAKQKARGTTSGLMGLGSVRTPCGPRRIENIRKGDLIVTRDSGLQAVRMVFSKTYSQQEISADPSLAPIRFRPRALGPMMPQQDLLLAPDHQVLVPGYRLADVPDTMSRLITARDIADRSDAAFVDKNFDEITYYNIVFDAHQIFCVNGLPVESFLPSKAKTKNMDKAVSGSLVELFPEFAKTETAFPVSSYAKPDDADYQPEFV